MVDRIEGLVRLHSHAGGRIMTDYEWPPDEIAGPPEDGKPQGKLASAKASGPPVPGAPIPVVAPPPGIAMAGPQPVGEPSQHQGPPIPPPGQQPPMPVQSAPVPVRPQTPPVPVTPNTGQGGPPPAPPAPPTPHPMQGQPPGVQPTIN